MEYPEDFPEHLKRKVDAAIHAAEIAFIDAKDALTASRFEFQADRLIQEYVETVFFGFATQAVEAGKEGVWNGERTRRALDDFLRDLGHRAYFDKHPDPAAYHGSERFRDALKKASKNWKGWRAIHEGLRRVAEMANAGSDRDSIVRDDFSSAPALDRRNEIESFIAKVLDQTQRRIKRKDIWRVAGYNNATQFERYQRGSARVTKSASANFSRVLRMQPREFLKLLNKKPLPR